MKIAFAKNLKADNSDNSLQKSSSFLAPFLKQTEYNMHNLKQLQGLVFLSHGDPTCLVSQHTENMKTESVRDERPEAVCFCIYEEGYYGRLEENLHNLYPSLKIMTVIVSKKQEQQGM